MSKGRHQNREAGIRWFTSAAFLLLVFSILLIIPSLLFQTVRLGPAGPDKQGPDISEQAQGEPSFAFRPVSVHQLDGWDTAEFQTAFETFQRSCADIMKRPPETHANPVEALGDQPATISFAGFTREWQAVCREAEKLVLSMAGPSDNTSQLTPAERDILVKEFFETQFSAFQIVNQYSAIPEVDTGEATAGDVDTIIDETGLYTGYFEPTYTASRKQTAQFSAPLFERPEDLVDLDLGQFRPSLAGQRLAGRVSEGRLLPYADRAEINQHVSEGSIEFIAPVLAWLDPDDAFFLQIQGSGTLQFADREVIRVGYAGQNGHPYTAIGKVLVDTGQMALEEVSLASIRTWLKNADPVKARQLRESNASYVFFRILDNLNDPNLGPLGAQGVQLTARRSLAVDRRYHAMGTPIWVDMANPIPGRTQPFRQLMIAQDTGGAIRGPVRGDVFWGRGDEAKEIAGSMRARGSMIVLLPNTVVDGWERGRRDPKTTQ